MAALQTLALNFNKEFSPLLLKSWLHLLKGYSAEQVEEGVYHVMLEYEYKTLPPIAVLVKAINRSSQSAEPSQDTLKAMAESEWANMFSQISRVGRYRTPNITNKTTAYVMRLMGGWGMICNWHEDETHWRHKEFVEHWILCYGKEDVMALGADSVLALDRERGCAPIQDLLRNAMPQRPQKALQSAVGLPRGLLEGLK